MDADAGEPTTKWSQPSAWIFGEWLTAARRCFVAGAFVALLGFALPWFKFERQAEWWYGGFWLMTGEGLGWLIVLFAGYALLALVGGRLLKQGVWVGAGVVVLSIGLTLSALLVVSLSLADALEEVRAFSRLVWSLGLFVFLPGHAALVFGACATWVLQAVEESFGVLAED